MNEEASQSTRPPYRRLKPGDVLLNRYEVRSVLGQGGMGAVLRCFDRVGGIDVAIKAIPPELSHHSAEMEDVRANFRLVEKLHHPNIAIAKTLELDSETSECFLVMECVDGVNLHDYVRRHGGRLSVEQAVPIVSQIAEALDYAHREKVIHRDVKPSNIMIQPDGRVKVLDFGIAAQLHSSMSRVSRVRPGTSGTGPYMSPEQWRGAVQDAATDQWSLGILVYALVAGRLPFDSHDLGVLREMILREPLTRPEGLAAGPWEALRRCLAKDPRDRFPSCLGFVERFGAEAPTLAVRGLTLGSTPAPRRRRGLLAAGVAALLVAAAAGGYRLWLERSAPAPVAPPREDAAARARAEALVREAESLRAQGDLAGALARYREARQAWPWDDAIARAANAVDAELHDRQRKEKSAAADAQAAAQRGKAEELVSEADALRAAGQPQEALKKYTEARVLKGPDAALDQAVEETRKEALDAGLRPAAEQLPPEKRQELAKLLAAAETALAAKKHAEASAAVRRAMELDPRNARAAQLKKQLAAAVGKAGVIPVQARAETKWKAVSGYERGQGFGAALEPVEVELTAAGKFMEAGEHAAALDGYEKVAAECERLQRLEADRQAARDRRDEAERGKAAAAAAGAHADAAALWSGAVKLAAEAGPAFEAGRFAEAEKCWQAALAEFRKAGDRAAGVRSARAARAAYEQAHAGLAPEARAGLEKATTGKGAEALAAAAEARRLEKLENWKESAAKWDEARAKLADAARELEAAGRQAAEARVRATYDAALADARQAETAEKWQAAGAAAEKALASGWKDTAEANALLARVKKRLGLQPGEDMALDLGGGVKMEFVWIKALNGWVGKYEVTNEEYRWFKKDHSSGEYEKHSLNGDRQPVVMVSYDDAVAFAEWVNRTTKLPEGYTCRLPDGKEWLTFAQCGDGRKYPWGNEMPPKYGNYADQTAKRSISDLIVITGYDDGAAVTCPVERSGKNDWGLYGVGGNVWEWTGELYERGKDWRVLRGGSWIDSNPGYLECANRFNFHPSSRNISLYGFRVELLR